MRHLFGLVRSSSALPLIVALCSCSESEALPEPPGIEYATVEAMQGNMRFNHDYVLNLSKIEQAVAIGDDIEIWARSLASRIGHVGDIHTFARANPQPMGAGHTTAGTTFLTTSGKPIALVKQANGQSVLIDLEQRIIGTMGTGGSSLHPHPSGNAIICLNPDGNDLLGVALDDKDKTGEEPPVFADAKVYWSWGDTTNQP